MSSAYCLISKGSLHFLPLSGKEQDTPNKGENYSEFLNHKSVVSLATEKLLQVPSAAAVARFSESNSSTDSISSFGYPNEAFQQPVTERQITSPTYPIIRGKPAERQIDPNVGNILSNYSTHSMFLPDEFIEPERLANPEDQRKAITDLLFKVFPHWAASNQDTTTIETKQLTGGITNMLLSCTRQVAGSRKPEIVLVRTYGQGTDLIIDRDREFVSQLLLNSLGLAPPIYAKFGNGLVYGYLPGRSLLPHEMAHPLLYPQIAQRLGQWHNLLDDSDIEESLAKVKEYSTSSTEHGEKVPSNIWELIKSWIKIVPEAEGLYAVCNNNKDIQHAPEGASLKEILTEELEWCMAEIGSSSRFVVCHSDLLSGNIIIPQSLSKLLQKNISEETPLTKNELTFIDYEYMMPGPRAFDIANHFMEWQGFECDLSRIPEPTRQNPIMRKWAKAYLSTPDHHSAASTADVSPEEVDDLIEEISLYYGIPGFYWGIWAGIQSSISLIDFDYSGYSGTRLSEYWSWKRKYLRR